VYFVEVSCKLEVDDFSVLSAIGVKRESLIRTEIDQKLTNNTEPNETRVRVTYETSLKVETLPSRHVT
jgi:hypothetical protein